MDSSRPLLLVDEPNVVSLEGLVEKWEAQRQRNQKAFDMWPKRQRKGLNEMQIPFRKALQVSN